AALYLVFSRTALLEAITSMSSSQDLTNDLAPSSWSWAARASTSIPTLANVRPRSRSPSWWALRSPRSVSGRSVSPVCWPVRLQAVSPCLARQTICSSSLMILPLPLQCLELDFCNLDVHFVSTVPVHSTGRVGPQSHLEATLERDAPRKNPVGTWSQD